MRSLAMCFLMLSAAFVQVVQAGNPTIVLDTTEESSGPAWSSRLEWDQAALAALGFTSVDGMYVTAKYHANGVVSGQSVALVAPESTGIAYFGATKATPYNALYSISFTSKKEYFYQPSSGAVVSIEIDYDSNLLLRDDDAIATFDLELWNSTYEFSIPKNLTTDQLYHPENYPEIAGWAYVINYCWGSYYGDPN